MVLSSIFRSSYKASLLWPLTLLCQDLVWTMTSSKKFDTFSHVKILNWITSVNFFLPDNIFNNYYYKMRVPLKIIVLSATLKLLCFKFGLPFQRLTFWVFETICIGCLKFLEVVVVQFVRLFLFQVLFCAPITMWRIYIHIFHCCGTSSPICLLHHERLSVSATMTWSKPFLILNMDLGKQWITVILK